MKRGEFLVIAWLVYIGLVLSLGQVVVLLMIPVVLKSDRPCEPWFA